MRTHCGGRNRDKARSRIGSPALGRDSGGCCSRPRPGAGPGGIATGRAAAGRGSCPRGACRPQGQTAGLPARAGWRSFPLLPSAGRIPPCAAPRARTPSSGRPARGAWRRGGKAETARSPVPAPRPHPGHVCARGGGASRRDPALGETPRPCGRGLRSGLWLRPRCSSGGGGRGQRGSFPCCVCRCLLAILLQSPFLSAGLRGPRGGRHRKGGRGRRKEEGSAAFFIFCINFF